MKLKFEKFDMLPEGAKQYTKTIKTWAVQIPVNFEVETMESENQQGKAGDYLMKGVVGELYPCDQEVFKKTYQEVKEDKVGKIIKESEKITEPIKEELEKVREEINQTEKELLDNNN